MGKRKLVEGSKIKIMKFIIPGKPLGKQRIRVTKRGISYTPKQTVDYQNYIKEMYIYNGGKMLEGAIGLYINAFLSIPKSISKVKRVKMLAGEIKATKNPDVDNIAKIYGDALNTIAFSDDRQIIRLIVNKYYSENPRVEIEIEELYKLEEEK